MCYKVCATIIQGAVRHHPAGCRVSGVRKSARCSEQRMAHSLARTTTPYVRSIYIFILGVVGDTNARLGKPVGSKAAQPFLPVSHSVTQRPPCCRDYMHHAHENHHNSRIQVSDGSPGSTVPGGTGSHKQHQKWQLAASLTSGCPLPRTQSPKKGICRRSSTTSTRRTGSGSSCTIASRRCMKWVSRRWQTVSTTTAAVMFRTRTATGCFTRMTLPCMGDLNLYCWLTQ